MSCLNQKVEEPLLKATTNEEFLSDLRESWECPYDRSSFLKDIPRLVKRVQVQTSDGVIHVPASEESDTVGAVVALVELVAADLGVESEAVSEIKKSLERSGGKAQQYLS